MEQYNNKATASLVLGIVSLVSIWFSYFTIIGIICAIIGLIFAIQIRKAGELEGFTPNGMATAGLILNIIGLALCALVLIACVACVGLLGTAAMFG
ncbi:hypothetical protein ACIZ62_02785 [Acetobacterium carbinolicum]|jgi:uncharacterized integral membrane protein|uniref:hypothetical protein n=1 Tax=Acetobacterium TaxID=33951 RepID=UPI000DBEC57B|nr:MULTISPECIES: hypothetical protein [unclassified Acetobacterium]AWW26830.1 hypothetical protein DOZ58_09430 [Acetobacterium sp. KB-1]MDK2941499.1 hypothetical protein [Acetobacterium sp.]MDZ5725167.1 hypothetical protein [Acetobacterium sp. K1/6]